MDKVAETVCIDTQAGTVLSAAEISGSFKEHVKALCRLAVAAENYLAVFFELALVKVCDYLVESRLVLQQSGSEP